MHTLPKLTIEEAHFTIDAMGRLCCSPLGEPGIVLDITLDLQANDDDDDWTITGIVLSAPGFGRRFSRGNQAMFHLVREISHMHVDVIRDHIRAKIMDAEDAVADDNARFLEGV